MAAHDRTLNKDALREVIRSGGLPWRQNSKSFLLTCPKCSKAKLYVRKDDGRCRCMRCGPDFSGWADYILSVVYGRPRAELAELLYGTVIIGTPDVLETTDWENFLWKDFFPAPDDEIDLGEVYEPPPAVVWDPDIVDLTAPFAADGLAYLERRGISLALATKYGLRYLPREKRVIFPVVVDSELRGWQARLIVPDIQYTSDGRKVVSPKIMTTGSIGGRTLMGQDRLRSVEAAILVEGPVDMIKCDTCPAPAVATMGKSYTPLQLDLLRRSGIKRLYVGFDDDADEEVAQIIEDVGDSMELYRLVPPAGREDLGDATPEEVAAQFAIAEPLSAVRLYTYLDPHPAGAWWANAS